MHVEGPSASLGLCLITRNEERFLRACVESVRDVVDEVVIVDTGSTDGTLDVANELADRVGRLSFDGDFAAARNAALMKSSTQWVLFLDADERMTAPEAGKLRRIVSGAPAEVLAYTVMRFNLFANGEFYANYPVRLMRRREDIKYERRVNESVAASVRRAGGRLETAPVFVNHFGYCRPLLERKLKAERYIKLIARQLDADPDDSYLCGVMAMHLRMLGRFGAARKWSDRSVAGCDDDARVWYLRGTLMYAVGECDAALAAFERADALAPDAMTANMLGVLHLVLGDLPAARADLSRALDHDARMLPAKINLGLVSQALGQWGDAARLFREVASENPAFLIDEWSGRTEIDCYRSLYNHTIFRFGGLAYHLALCEDRARALPSGGPGAWQSSDRVSDAPATIGVARK